MFDVLIKGGTVVDGSGGPAYPADLGITDEAVEAIGDLHEASARRVINAAGLTVSPGFIDTHAHSDGGLLIDPQHANGLRQGITTEIIGPDGISFAQMSRDNYRLYRRYVAGVLGLPPENLDMSSMQAFRANYHGKVAINVACQVAHAALRLETVGFRDVPLTGDALNKAKRMVKEGIEQGAVGFATGLSYLPNSYSDTEELVELCQEAKDAGGVYSTHLRNVNVDRSPSGGGVPEALEIGRRTGVGVHIEHYRTGPRNAGQTAKIMELIDKAKAEGVDCTLELYPYPSGSGTFMQLIPPEYHDGGPDELLARLDDPATFQKITAAVDAQLENREDEDVFTQIGSEKNRQLEGMSWTDAARMRGVSVGTLLCQILREEQLNAGRRGAPPHSTALWNQVSRDAVELLSRPDYMVGSDAICSQRYPHPRAYGTFPRLLGRLRRQFGILTLEQMVQRMSDNPARRFGLNKRGRIEKGFHADIVVFDPDVVTDTATYDDPRQFPVGIPFVLVNGTVAVDHGVCTGAMAGQAVP